MQIETEFLKVFEKINLEIKFDVLRIYFIHHFATYVSNWRMRKENKRQLVFTKNGKNFFIASKHNDWKTYIILRTINIRYQV